MNPPERAPEARPASLRERLGVFLRDLWPHLFPLRPVEEDGRITYHRHWIVLARNTALPLLVCLGEVVAWAYFLIGGTFPALLRLGWGPNLALAVISALPWGWLAWRYEDWRNDYYVVAPDRIIDVDRLPFGFGAEIREAPLGNVQNVLMKIPNFLAASLDFGDIEVETAGRQGGLVFHSIHHPRQAMAQVAARVEAFREARLAREKEAREKELLAWFSQYADLERISLVQGPPSAEVGQRVEIEWHISGSTVPVDTWLEWRLGDAPFVTRRQSGGAGNYRDSLLVPLAEQVPFYVWALMEGEEYRSPEQRLTVSDFRLEYPQASLPHEPPRVRWRHAAPAIQAEVLWDTRSHSREDAYPNVLGADREGDGYICTIPWTGEEALYFRLRARIGDALLYSPEHKIGGHQAQAGANGGPGLEDV